MADESTDDIEIAPPKSSKLGTLLTVINLVVTIVVAVRVMTFSPGAAPAAVADAPEETAADEPGPVVDLDPFVVNLNEPRASRFLRVAVKLEMQTPEAAERLTKMLLPVRNDLLGYLSGLSAADAMGEAAKIAIQTEIAARVAKVIGDDQVRNVFFGEFVIQ